MNVCYLKNTAPAESYTLSFFFNDTATTEIYTLSLHDALPIWPGRARRPRRPPAAGRGRAAGGRRGRRADRKSTRLNSSHANISYAVFCLKKKIHTNLSLVFFCLDNKLQLSTYLYVLTQVMIIT